MAFFVAALRAPAVEVTTSVFAGAEAAAALHPLDPRLRSFERQPLRTASSTLVEERSVHAKVTDFHMS